MSNPYADLKQLRTDYTIPVTVAFVNGVANMDFDNETFVEEVLAQHRTHQQSVMRAIAYLLDGWANQPCDLRNQATVQFATEVKPILDKYVFPHI